MERASSIALLAFVVAALYITPAEAARVTPSSRLSNVTYTAGAQTTTASIPATATWAVIGICMYNDTALQPPTSVTLDGQTATLIDSGGTTSTTQVALYKVSGFATGAGKTLAYTVGASGSWFGMDIAVDYRTGTPTYGAHASSAVTGGGPASTSGLANTSGDEFISVYCSRDTVGTQNPTVGTGQSKLDETWDSSGSIRYGFSTETGTGAADVQTIAAGGTGNIPSIAAAAVTTTTNASFTVGPTYATVSNTQISATFTASSGGATYYCALYAPGATAPTAVQLQGGTGAHSSVVTGSTTGSSESHNMTASDSPTFPKYDPYCVINSGTVATTTTTQTTPPTTCGASSNQACQYVTLSSVAIGGVASVATLAYDGQTANFVVGETVLGGTSGALALVQADTDAGATGTLTLFVSSGTFQDNEALTGSVQGVAVVNGTATYLYAANDVLVAPTYVSPAGASYPLTIAADGTAVYDTVAYDGGSGRATATNIKIYDFSAVGYAANDIDWVNNNTPPDCAGNVIQLVLLLNVAMTSVDLDNLCTDAESDTLNSIVLGTLPTGVTLNGTTNVTSGTPTVANTSGATVTYVVYDTSGAIGTRRVIYYPLATVAAPDCTTALTTLTACSNAFNATYISTNTFSITQACSTMPVGYVVSQDPVAGELTAPYSTVTLVSSLGACNDATVPNCLSKTSTQCLTLLNAASSYAVLTAPSCSASAKIFSQTPAANAQAAYNFTLTALCH